MRCVWLSFGDEKTGKNKGVAIVQITDTEILAAELDALERFPKHVREEGTYVVMAATYKAHRQGCNPGGQVLSSEVDCGRIPPDCFNRLMQSDELKAKGLV